MQGYMQDISGTFALRVQKVESIRKECKTIDDLLQWNAEVLAVVQRSPHARDVSIVCEDFKIFNPLNERLLSASTFRQCQRLKLGMLDEERFSRYLSQQNVLFAPRLKALTLQFSHFSVISAELLVRYFRDAPGTSMEFRSDLTIKSLRLEYQERQRDAVLQIMSGVMKANPYLESFELVVLNG